jgi:uncharacterized protein with GYD domain
MAMYISLVNYTQQGIANINSPARMDAARKAVAALTGKIHAVYLTMGRYDGVVIFEFPDDVAFAKFALSVASLGFMSKETLKALSEAEFRQVIDTLRWVELRRAEAR